MHGIPPCGHNKWEVNSSMLTVFTRTIILYIVSVLAIRLMGKRQVGQLQPYEFVLALMIAELAAAPMEDIGTPLLYGIVPILGMMILHGLAAILSARFTPVRKLLSGAPSVVIRNGAIQYHEMQRLCYTTSDLLEELRSQGYLNIADVYTAILETNGKLSVFPRCSKRPATTEEMNLSIPDEGIPMTLVVDGKIQQEHLKKCGLNEAWLRKQMHAIGIADEKTILLASLDTQGKCFLQEKNANRPPLQWQALDAKAVKW